jgi:hypothetical protein
LANLPIARESLRSRLELRGGAEMRMRAIVADVKRLTSRVCDAFPAADTYDIDPDRASLIVD